jgi:hypothetical protein
MFNWLKKRFGKGVIHFEFTDEHGKAFIGKAPYSGDPNSVTYTELKESISNQWQRQTGNRITKFEVKSWG